MEFQLLGPVGVSHDGRRISLGSPKQRCVLAAFLLAPGAVLSTDHLIQCVWGDSPPPTARGTLQSYLTRLRGALPPQGDGTAAIQRRAGGYLLTASAADVDLHRFRSLTAQARDADGDGEAERVLDEALGLWHGDPLAGIAGDWAESVRTRLEQERLAALLDRVDHRLAAGGPAGLAEQVRGLAAEHPWDERIAAQLMTVLFRSGRQAEALAHYEAFRRCLAQEFGVDPGAALRHLHEAILRDAPELGGPPARPARRPEATPDGVRDDWTAQFQLPFAVPGFVGRHGAVRELEDLFTAAARGETTAPVVITGTPGVGKTALAVHLGHRLRQAFPDGQWYVRLLGAGDRPRDPSEVQAALLQASGLDAAAIPESSEDRSAAYRGRLAGRRVLIVLDDAADAEQVRPLLPGAAGVAVLVTSRPELRGLGVSHAAHAVRLQVLEPDEAHTLLSGVLGESRVAAEPEASRRLAEQCARLPLALRIAAANLAARPGRSLESYATDLDGDGRLAKLSIAGDRRAAVRTAFDHSLAFLDPSAVRLFALLGLHPGPDFGAEAAAALLGAEPAVAEELLDVLADASLLQRSAADRFLFHDLLRLYAAEHAAALPAHEEAWRRLCDWYLATAEAATAFEYTGVAQLPRERAAAGRFADRKQALGWLDQELANLVAVVGAAAASGPRHISWQIADQLRMYVYYRHHRVEWKAVVTAGLHAAEAEGDTLARAAMLQSLGVLGHHTEDQGSNLEHFLGALEGYRTAGFVPGQASIMCNLAVYYGRRGHMGHAGQWQERGVELLRDLDHPVLLGNALDVAALIHSYLGESERAVERATEAIEISLRHGQPMGTISPLVNRAIAHHARGDFEAALADGTRALRLSQEHRKRRNEADAQEILARTHRDTGRLDLARPLAEQALAFARDTADPTALSDCLLNLGEVSRLSGELAQAAAHLEEALEITGRSGFRHQEAEARTGLARVRFAQGDAEAAAELAEAALAAAGELGLRPVEQRARTVLAAARRAE
ncbi:DNA-binding SARP family transcriptional activator [Streptomyces sp. KhCrAH-43]|uniref:AfsR/SARP family transcriptional regulator n=1 Tax=unclassified Streptomyces TaxID=2593676 RepID=UPI00037A565E|nr:MULTISPECIES: BTAD domain-containing putative transcriptional regulator [unclassified Streptomyces]MYS36153.1 tetratricopeptide repeat protein [Streptomyces sp. SID4920]MYX70782.1 tetratricopeptide repeat protein [Streptomyces sp. SID8373]RAJ55930.1 DNA-binding SARP family transcriptional activator [Streptomyces sp. KhCrAH-43]